MGLNNESGNTLVENVVAMFIFVIVSAMMLSAFLAGITLYGRSFGEYSRVNNVYSDIELIEGDITDSSGSSTVTSTVVEEKDGSISFDYAGDTIESEGTYLYDDEGEKVGEFVAK